MSANEFISKKNGLIVVRLNPENYFSGYCIHDYHYYLGLVHGELLQQEIRETEKFLPEFLQKTRGKKLGKIAYNFLVHKAQKIKKFIPQEYITEMKGVADGAKVNPDFILLINVFDELKNIYGCSALAIEEDNRLFYGINTDYAVFGDFLGPRNTVFIYQQKKPCHNFVSVAWPGYVGLIRGMNEEGVVLISLASYSKDQTIKGVPTSFLYRQIIEKFNNESLVAMVQRTIGNNILLGNKQEAVVIEVSANHLSARGAKTICGRKFVAATNHYQTEEMKQYQRPPKPVKGSTIPKDEEEKWFWNFFGLEGSKKRDTILKDRIEMYSDFLVLNSKKFTPEVIKRILSRVSNPYATLNSIIFDPENLELYIADNNGKMPATDGKLVKINI